MNHSYAPYAETELPEVEVIAEEVVAPIEKGEEDLAAPIEKRTVAMIVGALIVVPFMLYAGAAFFIPLSSAFFMSYALSPVVDWMERCHLPRAASAAMTMVLVTALLVLGVQQALSGTADVLEELPQAVQKLRYEVTSWQRDGKGGAVEAGPKDGRRVAEAGRGVHRRRDAFPRRRRRPRVRRRNRRRS